MPPSARTRVDSRPCAFSAGAVSLPRAGTVRHQPPRARGDGDDPDSPGDQQRRHGCPPGGERRRSEQRSCHPAHGEQGVERRHDRPSVPLLDFDGLRVHRHVQCAVGEAEHEQGETELPGRGRQPRAHGGGRQEESGDDHHAPAAEPVGQWAADLHAADRADREQEQQRTQRGVADAGPVLDRRNVHDPHAEQEPVDPEDPERSRTSPAERLGHWWRVSTADAREVLTDQTFRGSEVREQ